MAWLNEIGGRLMFAARRDPMNGRITVAAIMLTVSVLAGQFALSRIIPWLPEDLTRVRTLAILAAAIGFWPVLRKDWQALNSPPLLAFAALCAYLTARALFDHGDHGAAKATDIAIMLAQGGLAILAGRSAVARRAVVISILACAFVLLLIEMWGQLSFLTGEPARFGFGWGSMIGSITFNRIEFLAFCVALGVLSTQRIVPAAPFVGLAIIAALFLFATWGSLQKGALAATVIVLTGLVVAYLVQRQWRMAATLCVVTFLAAALTVVVFGSHVSGRFQGAARLSAAPAKPTGLVRVAQLVDRSRLNDAVKGAAERGIYPKPLPSQTSQASVTIRYCYFKSATLRERGPGTPVLCYKRTLSDTTSRLPLAIEAIRGFLARPIFGHGLASYRVEFIHPEVPVPDAYLYPHNLLLEVAFEGGGIGLVLLVFALAASFYWAWRGAAPTLISLPVLGFAGFMAISVLVSGDLYDSRLLWLALFLLSSWGHAAVPGRDGR